MLKILNGCAFCETANEVVVRFGGSGEGKYAYICRLCAAILLAAFEEPQPQGPKPQEST